MHLERHNQFWKLYTGTKVAYRGLPFREGLANFSKILLKSILHLLQKHGFESGLGRLQIFHRLKSFCTLWIKKYDKEEPGLLSSYNPIRDKNGTTLLSQKSSCWSPQFPNVYKLLLQEEGMLHSAKHSLVPTFLRCFFGAIKFKINYFS